MVGLPHTQKMLNKYFIKMSSCGWDTPSHGGSVRVPQDWKHVREQEKVRYRGFHEKGTFSVHSFNDAYLSLPERPGSYKYLFHEIPVISLITGSEII